MTTKSQLPAIVNEIQDLATKLAEHAAQHPQLSARLATRKAYAESLPVDSEERIELEKKNIADASIHAAMVTAHKSLTVELDGKKAAMGQEVLELIKCVNADLHDLLESPSVRSDPEVMESTLNEAVTQLAEAANLYVFVREAQRGTLIPSLIATAPVAAPTASLVVVAAVQPPAADDTPAVSVAPVIPVFAARQLEDIPLELSEYIMHSRQGKNLKTFVSRYQRQLTELFESQHFSVPTMTAFLKNRGLNGGVLTVEQVDTMLRNGGVRMKAETLAQRRSAAMPKTLAPATQFVFQIRGVDAAGEPTKYGFKVKAGATGHAKTNASYPPHLHRLRAALIEEKVARLTGKSIVLCKDYVFTSTSAAAAFLTGYTVSGPLSWQPPMTARPESEQASLFRGRAPAVSTEARAQA